jgi:hypothetical protein
MEALQNKVNLVAFQLMGTEVERKVKISWIERFAESSA